MGVEERPRHHGNDAIAKKRGSSASKYHHRRRRQSVSDEENIKKKKKLLLYFILFSILRFRSTQRPIRAQRCRHMTHTAFFWFSPLRPPNSNSNSAATATVTKHRAPTTCLHTGSQWVSFSDQATRGQDD